MSGPLAVLAAGGTGGHLFPAQALSTELQERGWIIDLVTDERSDRYDFKFSARTIHIVSSDTFRSKNPVAMARTAMTLGKGFFEARRILNELHPKIVIGFGGYPSLMPMLAASFARIPTLLHEQNAVLGRANKLLAPRVSAIGLSFEKTALLEPEWKAKARVVGIPVRAPVLAAAETAYKTPGDKGQIHLLVFGGSQGARIFADIMPAALAILPDELRARFNIVQQAREEDKERLESSFTNLGLKNYEIATFFKDMPKRMAKAHLIIARSGASTVAEIAVIGRPAILVPLPHAIDNDQLKNARNLADSGAAILAEQKDLSPERMAALLSATLQDPLWMESRARAAKSIGRPNAAKLLADLVEATAAGQTHVQAAS